MAEPAQLPPVYQLKVWLQGISPMVWRRLLVRSDSTIADLHYTLQIALGWTDSHLNRFHIHGKDFGVYHIGGMSFADDPEQVPLSAFGFRARERFLYEYDFGDAWLHEVRIEKRLPLDPKRTYPVCIDGKQAAPPEDCGGALAYMRMRQQLKYRALFGGHGWDNDFDDEDEGEDEGASEDRPFDPDDYGPAGVGKTLSARRYARWDLAEPLLLTWGPRDPSDTKVYAALSRSRAVFYTPTVGGGLRELREELNLLTHRVNTCIDQHIRRPKESRGSSQADLVELLVIDEAERLSATALEYVRDWFDRADIGLLLIGMPGIEKRMARYPQLYSRVGFAHHYRPLHGDELSFVLTRHWRQLGLTLDDTDFTDNQAITAIARITGGNFRLLQRLFVQIERVLRINDLTVITNDVVEAARSTLVIGVT